MVSRDTIDLVHTLDSVVRGHHVYKRIWTPTVGEQLQLRPEEDNESDPRAVAILKHGVIVGYLPRKTARTMHAVENFSARLILRFDFLRARNKNSQFAIIRLSQLKPVIRYIVVRACQVKSWSTCSPGLWPVCLLAVDGLGNKSITSITVVPFRLFGVLAELI